MTKSGVQFSIVRESVITDAGGQRLEVVPAVYETQNVEVVVQEASKRLEVVPAQYEMQNVEVVVKEASKRIEVIPATYGTEKVTYKKREYGNSLKVIPAKFSSEAVVVEVKSKLANWQMSERAPDCASSDPNDCRYWCYKETPAQFTTVRKTVLDQDASVVSIPDCDMANSSSNCGDATYTKTVMLTPPSTKVIDIPAVTKTFKKRVMVTAPTTRVIEIPAVTKTIKKTVMKSPPSTVASEVSKKKGTITKTVLIAPAQANETMVDARHKTITKEVLRSKGGLTTWKEVECALVEYNDLNVKWNTGSAVLTPESRAIIDARLLSVLHQNEGSSVEIASHTDSRGSKEGNQALSERRALAVANYLISKGINPSRLVSNGYGEARLTNRCEDGVSCTEREHANNRRTQFRLINSK